MHWRGCSKSKTTATALLFEFGAGAVNPAHMRGGNAARPGSRRLSERWRAVWGGPHVMDGEMRDEELGPQPTSRELRQWAVSTMPISSS